MAAAAVGIVVVSTLSAVALRNDTPAHRAEAAVGDITAAEEDLLDQAEQFMLRDCMAGRSFRYWPYSRDSIPDLRRRFPYLIDDLGWARQHGVGTGLRLRVEQMRTQGPNHRYFRSLPRERRAALLVAANGPRPQGLVARLPGGIEVQRSDEGCTSETERVLYGDLRLWFRVKTSTSQFRPMQIQRVTSDPRFTQAQARWAQCMKGRGFAYASPSALHAAFPVPDRPRRNAREIRAGIAEASCAIGTGFAATARTLDAQYAAAVRRENHHDVVDKNRLQRAALPRARNVVARG